MFATAGSSARVAGPLLVTEVYEQLGSYWMLGIVAILMVSSPVICENITKGRVKKKKKSGNFPTEGGPFRFGLSFPLFLFIFNNGLNHPEMQRNFRFTSW